MESDIRFLRDLEQDLQRAVVRERKRALGGSRAWKWAPAVAAVLVVAWGIGAVVENPGALRVFQGSEESTADGGSAGGGGDAGSRKILPEAAPSPMPVEGPESWSVGDERARGDGALSGFDDVAEEQAGSPTVDRDPASATAFGDLSKIIRTGRMRLKVADGTFRDARDAAVAIAEGAGGFVLDSRVEGRAGTFTLRVPAQRFDPVMTRLGRLGDVELEEQNGQDVTAEYVDLTARSEILTARRDVIQELMDEATSLQQTLLLQNRFDEVQLQLERITGQLRFLNDQVAESTIRLEIVERTAPQQRQELVDNPSLLEAWKRGIQGFLNVLAVAIIGLGYLLPLLVAIGVWFGIKEAMKRRRRS